MKGKSRKYATEQQRLVAIKESNKKTCARRFKSRYFRLVIPNLIQYSSFQDLYRLKGDVLVALRQRQIYLQYYSIAVQIHPTTGIAHLDILLLYEKSVLKSFNRFDYLIKHGNLTRYRNLNQAILQYGRKQDSSPLSNLPQDLTIVLQSNSIRSEPHVLLRQAMLQDPFHFQPLLWLKKRGLMANLYLAPWQKTLTLLKRQQQVECNRILTEKFRFQLITPALIEQKLNSAQKELYYGPWNGYRRIVDYLNQIVIYGTKRPFKSKHLLITGPAGIGKTSLISQPNNQAQRIPLQQLVSTYYMGMRHWFPKYQDGVYKLIFWNQMKLTSYSYDFLLKFLEGSPVDLPYHGGATKKADNQLIYMTSNLSLQRHIQLKFWNHQDRESARQNLSKRIEQIKVPPGYNLFLLQRLIVPV